MKKLILSIIIFVLAISISACNPKVVPMENPESELFSVFYEGEDYTILIRTNIDPDALYYAYARGIGNEKDNCVVGDAHIKNYRVLYKEKYYDIVDGENLGLYSVQDLMDMGIENISCQTAKE